MQHQTVLTITAWSKFLHCISKSHTAKSYEHNKKILIIHFFQLCGLTGSDLLVPSVLWRCWLGGRPVKNLSGGLLAWLSVWSEMQTCIWPSWCHCHSLSLASVKSRLVLPFWYRLTQVVQEKGSLNGCVCVCVVWTYCFAAKWCRRPVTWSWVKYWKHPLHCAVKCFSKILFKYENS